MGNIDVPEFGTINSDFHVHIFHVHSLIDRKALRLLLNEWLSNNYYE